MRYHASTALLIDPEVQDLLEERGIREENLRQVLQVAESETRYHRNPATGRNLASATVGQVTYWVEYGFEEKGVRIFNAYSHRMRILEGFNLPSKKKPEDIGWLCAKCDLPLELAAVKLAYLDETFVADLHACPSCQRVFISEEHAVSKMALAERMLEDK